MTKIILSETLTRSLQHQANNTNISCDSSADRSINRNFLPARCFDLTTNISIDSIFARTPFEKLNILSETQISFEQIL